MRDDLHVDLGNKNSKERDDICTSKTKSKTKPPLMVAEIIQQMLAIFQKKSPSCKGRSTLLFHPGRVWSLYRLGIFAYNSETAKPGMWLCHTSSPSSTLWLLCWPWVVHVLSGKHSCALCLLCQGQALRALCSLCQGKALHAVMPGASTIMPGASTLCLVPTMPAPCCHTRGKLFIPACSVCHARGKHSMLPCVHHQGQAQLCLLCQRASIFVAYNSST